MLRLHPRRGSSNSMYMAALASLVVVVILGMLLANGGKKRTGQRRSGSNTTQAAAADGDSTELFMYCAAGMRYPLEEIAERYEQEYGVVVQLQYGGSNTLLSQLEVSKTGDLYLAGDNSYTQQAHDKGLAHEQLPLARMKPVIAVQKDNPKNIRGISDLLRDDVKVAVGNPEAAAIGKKVRKLLTASGHWEDLNARVTDSGVFKPTVNEVANDVKLGSVDAGIIWDSTVTQYDELIAIETPELDGGLATIEIAVLASSQQPTQALHFARYVAARDRGLAVFAKTGFDVLEGDKWADAPEITFFSGSINRRALDPIIKAFEEREGVTVLTRYDGCGILTAQMRIMRQDQASGFPDAYMACDVYYLDTVRDWFQDDVNISEAEIVLVARQGNPKNIRGLDDLLREDVRLVLGHPEQCTIGVLTTQLLKKAGIYEQLTETKDIPMKPSSAMLIPDVITEAADVTVAYVTHTVGEADKLEVIHLGQASAKAVQPYSIARSSDFKQLTRRLYDHIAASRNIFESAGFTWRLDQPAGSE